MFAIVKIGGTQYRITVGETVTVAKMAGKEGDEVVLDQVLLVGDEKNTKIGTPTVKGVVVKAKILSHGKGEKLNVRRFKSKVRERKSVGFHPQNTRLSIVSIG